MTKRTRIPSAITVTLRKSVEQDTLEVQNPKAMFETEDTWVGGKLGNKPAGKTKKEAGSNLMSLLSSGCII